MRRVKGLRGKLRHKQYVDYHRERRRPVEEGKGVINGDGRRQDLGW